jgi:hypothetical protein
VFAQNVQTIIQRSMGGAGCRVWIPSLVALLVCVNAVCAQTNPFEAILTRNLFGLVPEAPPAKAEPPPLPKITLTGITTVTGVARALFQMPSTPGKSPGGPGGERYFNLKMGEREDEVEVLRIDERAGIVVVAYSGTVIDLKFEKNVQPAAASQLPPPQQLVAPSPLPNPPGVASRTPEENVLLYEANRAKNEERIQAGVRLPKMPAHPLLNGQ